MFKKVLLSSAALVLILILSGCAFNNKETSAKKDDQKVVKLGVIGPLSGDVGVYGQEIQGVLNWRLEAINKKYADKHIKFELVYEDGKCTGQDAVSAFQKLKEIDGVKFFIGGACSSETLAIAPLVKAGETLAVSPLSSSPAIEGLNPYVFSVVYSDTLTATKLAEVMANYKNIAIITEQNDYNLGVEKAFLENIKRYPNAKVGLVEKFPKGSADFRTLLNKVKESKPDALLLNPNNGVTAINLLKQLAEMKNWTGYKIFTHYAYSGEDSRKAVGSFTNGMVIIDTPRLTNEKSINLVNELHGLNLSTKNISDLAVPTLVDTMDTLTDLIFKYDGNVTKVRDAFATGHFSGYSDGIYFDNKNFSQGWKAASFEIVDGKFEPYKN